MKKLLTTLLAIAMILAMCIPVMAETTTGSNTGSITITNATEGRTYTAYKIFSATGSGSTVAYTTDSTGKSVIEADTTAPFEVSDKADANNQYSVTAKSDASETAIIDWISENYDEFASTGKTGTYSGGTYTISDLPYGYYYVTTGTGTAISIDTVTGENKEIIDKNPDKPNNPSKTIIAEDGQEISDGVTANDAKVGSVETFKVSYNARNTVTIGTGKDAVSKKITSFYIEDTPTGLSIDLSSVAVTVNGETITSYTKALDDENGALKITIPWVNSDETGSFIYTPKTGADGDIPVVVTYNATVTAEAAIKVAENTVEIKYMRKGDTGYEGKVTDPVDPPGTTTTTYKFRLNKTDGTNALAGAQFELYDDENTRVEFVEDGATYRLATADDTATTTTIDMTENTTVYITGLDNETYTLKEIKAPDGYNLAADTTIGSTSSSEANQVVAVNADSYGDGVTVVNNSGATLPTTGGIGTTIFYALGAILVIGAGVALIVRRRMNSER